MYVAIQYPMVEMGEIVEIVEIVAFLNTMLFSLTHPPPDSRLGTNSAGTDRSRAISENRGVCCCFKILNFLVQSITFRDV